MKRSAIQSAATALFVVLGHAAMAAQLPVNLGAAGNFAILSKSGITDVPTSVIVGDVGTSPASGSYIGLTCPEVTGTIFSVDGAGPLPCRQTNATLLTAAIGAMQTAYTDAAGRSLPDYTELYSGDVSGQTLTPGLYKWSTNLIASSDFTLAGGPNDVWIMQIAQDLIISNGVQVHLSGGAKAKNIFWQIGGGTGVSLGTTSHFEGIILAQAGITMKTGATINGSLYAQTSVTLQSNSITSSAQHPTSYHGTSYIFPSPAKGDFSQVAYHMLANGHVTIRVYNEAGGLVDNIQEDKFAGDQTTKIHTGAFAPGVYLYLVTIDYASGAQDLQSPNKFVVTR